MITMLSMDEFSILRLPPELPPDRMVPLQGASRLDPLMMLREPPWRMILWEMDSPDVFSLKNIEVLENVSDPNG